MPIVRFTDPNPYNVGGVANIGYNLKSQDITVSGVNLSTGPYSLTAPKMLSNGTPNPSYPSYREYWGVKLNGFDAALRQGMSRMRKNSKVDLLQYAPRFVAAGQPVSDSPFASADFAAGIFGEAALK